MNLKVLFIIFLCLSTASIICNMATMTLNVVKEWSYRAFADTVDIGLRYLPNNATGPTSGDPRGPGWP